MEIVTGDRYLEFLVNFVDRNAGALLEGSLTLKLNPVGLHYVQSRLEALQELEGFLAGAPVDFLRRYVSDLGDHRALEQLRRILGLLTSLKVMSVLPPLARDPTPLSLQPFGRLRVLELRGCDLSTSFPRGLLELRQTLEKLICHNSTNALRHVFASRIADIKDSPVWTRLNFVSCAQNKLILMDESLQLLPFVETLDLSRNQFAKVDNIGRSSKLRHLDLGFNHLRTIARLSEVSCPIVKLVLRNNAITTLRGIENLKSIEGLDLSCNLISCFSAVETLANLPHLQYLWLEGNPISWARWYRATVYSFFSPSEKLMLDGNRISTKEFWERHVIYASRQKKPPANGFYFPAENHTEEDSSSHTVKRKHSRLASIENEEQMMHHSVEAVEQNSMSCDSDMLGMDDNIASDDESKIVGMMNKVEQLKKESSVLWLRDFKDWMNHDSKVITDRDHRINFNLNAQSVSSGKPLTVANFGENLHHANKTLRESGNGNFVALNDDILDKSGITVMEPFVVDDEKISVTALSSQVANLEQNQIKDDFRIPEIFSPLIVKDSACVCSSSVGQIGFSDLPVSSASFTSIDEIIESHPSSTYTGSPLHYKDDILHQRLSLEEELQQSAKSYSVELSDSDTSCSDDESCGFSISTSDDDCIFIQGSSGLKTANQVAINVVNNHLCDDHEKSYFSERNVSLSEHLTKHCSFSSESTSSFNNYVDATRFYTGPQLNQVAGKIERINCKQQFKRGFVSVFGNLLSCNSQFSKCEKANGDIDSCRFDKIDVQDQSCCCANDDSFDRMNIELLQSKHKEEARFIKKGKNNHLKEFINSYIANSNSSKTSQQIVFCGCIYQHGSLSYESEAALIRSCKNKIYLLLLDIKDAGVDVVSSVQECHRIDAILEVVTGLGLQVLRACMEGGRAYLLLTRTIQMSEDVFNLLQLHDSSSAATRCPLRSWEHVQVDLLEKCVAGSFCKGIYFYSMLLFWHDRCEGKPWLPRSLFVIEGHIIVCSENLSQFGLPVECLGKSPYFSLEFHCPIQNILEAVMEGDDEGRYLSLLISGGDDDSRGKMAAGIPQKEEEKDGGEGREAAAAAAASCRTWKLKWFSEDYLTRFLTLIKALSLGASSTSLPVKSAAS